MKRDRDGLKIFLIVLINIIVWCCVCRAPFLWDDEGVIVNNIFVNSLISVKFFFSKSYFDIFGELSYRPVVTLSHILDTVIFGKNPVADHCINLLIHICNCVLLFLILNKFKFINNTIKFFAAVFFSIHPVHLETLFVVGYRDDLLMGLFLLSACYSYILLRETRKKRYAVLSGIFFVLSVFSKETGIVFLPIIFFSHWLFFKNKVFKYKWFYFFILLLSCIFLLIRFVYMRSADESLRSVDFTLRYPLAFRPTIIFLSAARVCLVPFNVILDYHNKSTLKLLFIQGLIVISVLVAFYIFIKNKKSFLFALIIILFGLLPVMNIYPLENFFANRYMYLPAMGFSIILAICVTSVCPKKKNIQRVVFLLIVILMSIVTQRGARFFKSDLVFAHKLLSDSRSNYKALNYFGTGELDKGNLGLAQDYFRQALDINANYYEAVYNLALVYNEKKENEKAFETASFLVELNRGCSHGYRLLGDILYSSGLLDESEDYYKEALKVNRYDIQAGNNLGIVYEAQKKFDKAADIYVALLSIYPKFDLAWSNLGNVNIKRKDYGFAERCFLSALKIEPGNAKTWYNLGNAYYYQKKYANAEKCYSESSNIDKFFSDPLHNLAVVCISQNKKNKAIETLEKYLQLSPSDNQAVQTLKKLKKSVYNRQ
ncbi:tetratricopeptide repeat protein [bacterium]|nr:tetratricopeptide repeat protein [bacterium]